MSQKATTLHSKSTDDYYVLVISILVKHISLNERLCSLGWLIFTDLKGLNKKLGEQGGIDWRV